MLERITAQGLYPGRGVCAGGFAATYCLKAYLFKMVKVQQDWHPGITITIRADDFANAGGMSAPEAGKEARRGSTQYSQGSGGGPQGQALCG